MSPTIFREKGFRFFFFSREEPRIHVHVHHSDGEAKFWLTPQIQVAHNHGLTGNQEREARELIEAHIDEITHAWQQHFGS